MTEQFKNKIKRLELENFTCFGKVAMDFSPGINVFIGENGTGKTHLLKALFMTTSDEIQRGLSNEILKVKTIYPLPSQGIIEKYYPSSISAIQLINKKNYADYSTIKTTYNNNEINLNLENNFLRDVEEMRNSFENKIVRHSAIFVPPNELISWYKGFIASYENRETYIDPLYYFFAKAIEPLPLKGKALELQYDLLKTLEDAIQAKVIRRGDEFLIQFVNDKSEYPVPIVATGINKIAQLIYLIMNGSLTKDTILFWDEPEANLNPKYILIVTKFLQTLANAGCQIFVATHDYLLPYELSLSKEYANVAEGKVPDMKFFSLYKGENGTEVEEGETMPDLRNDAIMEGAGRHNDREDILFRKSLNNEK